MAADGRQCGNAGYIIEDRGPAAEDDARTGEGPEDRPQRIAHDDYGEERAVYVSGNADNAERYVHDDYDKSWICLREHGRRQQRIPLGIVREVLQLA